MGCISTYCKGSIEYDRNQKTNNSSHLFCFVDTANGKESFKESGGPSVLLSVLKEDYRDEELSYLLLEALNPLVMHDGNTYFHHVQS